MRKLIPILMILLGLGGGLGAGYVLRPLPQIDDISETDAVLSDRVALPTGIDIGVFEIPNQFMVPLIVEDRIASVLIVTLAMEIDETQRDLVATHVPRLRDAMLQVMFDHANSGGFSGAFTTNATLGALRNTLLEAGQYILGRDVVLKVLITDILRSGP
jgi:flagellar FliL protein